MYHPSHPAHLTTFMIPSASLDIGRAIWAVMWLTGRGLNEKMLGEMRLYRAEDIYPVERFMQIVDGEDAQFVHRNLHLPYDFLLDALHAPLTTRA